MKIRHVLQTVAATPWAIVPEKLDAVVALLQLRANGGHLSAEEIRAAMGDGMPAAPRAQIGGGVAVIPIQGVLVPRCGAIEQSSGMTSSAQLGAWIDEAVRNDAVNTIVFDIDSPGGQVGLIAETWAKIMDAREAKRCIAVANTMAASAAYWLASACDEIVVTPSGEVGAIGVLMVYVDESQADAEAGVQVTTISAGKYKADGQYGPLSPDALAAIQGRVDEFYGMFVSAVAKGRGVSSAAVRNGFGEGRVCTASQAKAAGMCDRIASMEDVMAKLTNRRPPRSFSPRGAAASVAAAGFPFTVVSPADTLAAIVDREVLEASAPRPIIVPKLDEPDASRGGSAPLESSTPTLAPVAKEKAMEPEISATSAIPAPGNAGDRTLQAELARVKGFRALRKEHPTMAAKLEQLEEHGASLEAAQVALTEAYRAQVAAAPRGVVGDPSPTGALPNEAVKPFASLGEQLIATINAGKGLRPDVRLLHTNSRAMAVASGMNESVGSEGGFFIQPELMSGVIDPVFENDPIVSRVNRIPISGNAIKYNVVDETSRANGSRWGGIQAFWQAEADTAAAKKPKLRLMELALKKIIGLGYLTDELQVDAPAAEALLGRAFQSEVAFMMGDACFRGLGGGMPLGFLNSSAMVSQAIEGTQTIANSNQFIALNLAKMLARVPASLWGQMIWLYNQELLPKLITASISGTAGTIPVFMTQGGFGGKPFDTILGRPAFASELCEQEGTVGDIVALVPSQYDMIDKGGPQMATSLHVRFINDENTLRITYRTDGAPRWNQPVTRFKGSASLSPYVTLAARS